MHRAVTSRPGCPADLRLRDCHPGAINLRSSVLGAVVTLIDVEHELVMNANYSKADISGKSGRSRQPRTLPIELQCGSCDVWRRVMVKPWLSSSSPLSLVAWWRRLCRHTSASRTARRRRSPKGTCLPRSGRRRRTDKTTVHTLAWMQSTCSRSTHAFRRPWPLHLPSAAATASRTAYAGEVGASQAPLGETPDSWRAPPAPDSYAQPGQRVTRGRRCAGLSPYKSMY